jgi:hypothetical protein
MQQKRVKKRAGDGFLKEESSRQASRNGCPPFLFISWKRQKRKADGQRRFAAGQCPS